MSKKEREILRSLEVLEEKKRSENSPELIIRKYSLGQKKILHLGILHWYYNKGMDFSKILKEIKYFEPDCVIFEMENKDCEDMKKMNPEERKYWFGENGIIFSELDGSISVFGSDINHEDEASLKEIEGKFSEEEIQAYKIYTRFPSIFLNGNLNPIESLKESAKSLNLEFGKRIEKIIRNYVKRYLKKDLENIKMGDDLSICPYYLDNPLSLIAKNSNFFREEEMVSNCLDMMKNYKRIVIINGRNHVIRQEAFWKFKERVF